MVAKVSDEPNEDSIRAFGKSEQHSVTRISSSENIGEPKCLRQEVKPASQSDGTASHTNQTKDQVLEEIKPSNAGSTTALSVESETNEQKDVRQSQSGATKSPNIADILHLEKKELSLSLVSSTESPSQAGSQEVQEGELDSAGEAKAGV